MQEEEVRYLKKEKDEEGLIGRSGLRRQWREEMSKLLVATAAAAVVAATAMSRGCFDKRRGLVVV